MTWTGTASLTAETYNVLDNLNAYSTASIGVKDKDFANQATLQANLLKSTILTHIYGNKVFRGELRDMSISFNTVNYEASNKAKKLLNQQANYNPKLKTGYVRNTLFDSNLISIIDRGLHGTGPFTTDQYNSKLFHWSTSRKNKVRVSPMLKQTPTILTYIDGVDDDHKTTGAAATDTLVEAGNEYDTYYNDESTVNVHMYANGALPYENYAYEFEVYIGLRDGIDIDTIDSIDLSGAFNFLPDFGAIDNEDDPCIGLYNYGTSSYEVAYIKGSDLGTRYRKDQGPVTGRWSTGWINKSVTINDISGFDTGTSYRELVTTIGNFKIYRMKIMIGSGQDILNLKEISLRNVYLNMTLDADNTPDSGYAIITDTTLTELIFNNYTSIPNPLHEGMSQGDSYILTELLTTQISDLATAWGITINQSITVPEGISLTKDYTMAKRIEVLQDICDLINAYWYYDDDADAYNIITPDNTVSTGITITRKDMVGYLSGNWSYRIKADNIREKIIGKGDSKTDPIELSITPEFAHTLGTEQEIMVDSQLNTSRQIAKMISAKSKQHTDAIRIATFTLDYDNPYQSYAAIEKGKSFALQIPDEGDTGVCNHITGQLGELLITQIQWIRNASTGNRRHAIITGELRHD